jgi:cytidylate kinase/diadenosine tetraphosphate (Ap4A) HIT family hydrolase
MLSNVPCFFCRAGDDDLLVDEHPDGTIVADKSPLVYGHLLVSATEHVSSVLELTSDARRRLLHRVAVAQQVSIAIAGRRTIAVEHGRSPTCGDPSGETHAHVHVLPVGEFDSEALLEWDAISLVSEAEAGSYLAVYERNSAPALFMTHRPVLHAARSLASLVASANGVPWRPLTAGADHAIAHATAADARRRLLSTGQVEILDPAPLDRELAHSTPPAILVSGPTGSGKTTVGAALAQALRVPAVELGVILRLACVTARPTSDGALASLLWRWHRTHRLDFDGVSDHGLAAALPRLDGSAHETMMWQHVETDRLSDSARGERTQEALSAIAEAAAARGAVVVGRVSGEFANPGIVRLDLDAVAHERARRKRAQLQRIGLGVDDHDWFTPRQASAATPQRRSAQRLDTSDLSREAMVQAALAAVGIVSRDRDSGAQASR